MLPTIEAPTGDLAATQSGIAEGILGGVPLRSTLESTCRLIEDGLPGTRSSIRVRDRHHSGLVVTASPDLPTSWLRHIDLRDGVEPGAASRLWCPGACSWVEDLEADEAWAHLAGPAHQQGLRAALTYPVLAADGSMQALLTVYWPETHWPTGADRRVVHLAAVLVAMAVAHHDSQRALATAASHDPLTGLPNRTLFVDRLRQSLARARRRSGELAVLFLDLDRFKVINDSLGHAAGDRLLMAAAARLQGAVRPEDTVARFGGDEFVVLCEEVDDIDTAVALGQRLLDELRKPFVVAQRRFFATASIGVALGGASSRPQDLIRDADLAMYRSKELGRNRIEVFDAGLRVRTVRRLEDEAALRRVLELHEVSLHYQPVVELSSMRVRGMEALLRNRRADGGRLDPMDLVGIAEEAGLVHALGAQVLGAACAELRSLADAGLADDGFTVGVNVAGSQLSDGSLVETIAETLEHNGLRPDQLTLEVTESCLGGPADGTPDTLAELDRLGVGLWIDDFGAGYSSLSRLRQLPVRGVKIDESFVAGLRSGSQGRSLVEGITGLARSLDMMVIAGGVEDDEQLGLLRRIGVDGVQGYLLGRPCPPEELPAVLAGRTGR